MKFDPYQFEKVEVEGVPVYVKNIPWANDFVYVRFAFPIGTREDPDGKEGLAHFFEHLPFNGCEEYPTFDEIREVNKRLFLNTLNAYTNFEYTQFFGKIANRDLEEALLFMKNFVFYPILDTKEIERKQKVITQEIWRKYSNEREEELAKKLNKLFYENHTFARTDSALGWHNTISTITREEFISFHKKFYHLGNLNIFLVGDINKGEVAPLIAKIIDDCPNGEKFPWPEKIKNWTPPAIKRSSISAKEFFGLSGSSIPKTTKIVIQRAFPILENSHIVFTLRGLLWELLFQTIRGKLGAVYSPQIYTTLQKDHILVEIKIQIEPSLQKEIEDIVTQIFSEISREDRKHLKLFEEIKKAAVERIKFIDVSAADVITDAANEFMRTGYVESNEESVKKAESVTYADVAELVKREFAPEKLFWAILEP